MAVPLEKLLKTAAQQAVARLQDTAIEALLEVEPSLVMHGGTAIWRCYGGNRFSEDLDMYANKAQVEKLQNRLSWALSKRNASMEYPKHGLPVFQVFDDAAQVKIEIMFAPKNLEIVQMPYQRADGTTLFINTLSVRQFISEKIATYEKRKYVRDLYDIYHLADAQALASDTKRRLRRFLEEVEAPIDEPKLKDLVYSGVAPSFDAIISALKVKTK